MFVWSCMNDMMSVAGDLAQPRLHLSRMKGSLPTIAVGSWEGPEGNRGENWDSKGISSKRRLNIAAVLVLVVAVIRGGGLWSHRNAVQEYDRAFASYRAAFKTYKVQESEYRKYLASDEVKSASAISDDLVSDAKTVRAMAKSVQTVKLVSSRSKGVKPGLTGDASTCELKKATETLNAQTLDLKSKLKALKADVFAVTTSQAHKQLLDPLGNRDKVLTESEGKVLDGD